MSVELWPVRLEDMRPPVDLAKALSRAGGGRAFGRLAPSHRREWLRYIDDARTPQARAQRIARTIDQVLGRSSPPLSGLRGSASAARRPLWTCPRCGNQFVNRNQWHSCARHEFEDVFAHRPAAVRALFEGFRAMVESLGPVKLLAYRNRVAFMVRVRFAGAIPRKDALDVAFWLPRRVPSPRFHRVETITANAHVHMLRLTEPRQLDSELAGWLRQAYAVGCQQHLRR